MNTLIKSILVSITGIFSIAAFAQQSAAPVAYNGEAGRIINENCVVCHQEGGIGPMRFETYEQVRPWAPLIKMRVENREMPPYAYDQHIGIQDLQGDWRLEQSEIDTLVAWIDQGAPLGDNDAPLMPDFPDPDQWNFVDQFGQPTMVIPSIPIDIPAEGNDMWSSHYVPSGIETDRCIKAIQVKPRGDAKAVVHHANSSIQLMNEDGELENHSQLTEYAMGKWGEIVPDDVCRTIPADALVRWGIHMYPGGIGATAQGETLRDNVVEIGLWLHPEGYEAGEKRYTQDLKQYHAGVPRNERDAQLIIPPNSHQMTQGFHTFDHPVRIDSFQPHGHLRLVAASIEIYHPDTGRTEPISQVSNWSAIWHHSHIYEPDVAPLVPTGAVLVLKHWYDNTVNNPNNPDPDMWVTGGDRTADEMTHDWIAITHLDEEGYEKLVAEREARLARSLTAN